MDKGWTFRGLGSLDHSRCSLFLKRRCGTALLGNKNLANMTKSERKSARGAIVFSIDKLGAEYYILLRKYAIRLELRHNENYVKEHRAKVYRFGLSCLRTV
jgi:hypothetical protein